MKRFLSCLLALTAAFALSACTAQTPPAELEQVPAVETVTPVVPPEETEPFVFTRENLPRLDGSTSTAPLAQAMCAVLLGEDLDAVANLIRFSRTTQSYRNLMEGSADLLLAAEPAPEVLAELEAGDQWLLTPFATDALVFVVNENNPVDGLTTEQVQKIYTGEITNWSEVGGDDLNIVPFQRNAEAGSQTMFEKLVMTGQPLMEPLKQWTSDSMSGLLEAVREYDNSPCAIGYTVYYYANDMEMAKGLKVLSIDGVTPSADAIRAGEYPFLNPYFVAIAKDAPEDSSIRALYDWVLGPEGQKLAAQEGYVPVMDVEATAPENSSSAPHPDVDAGRWYPYTVTDLIPGGDYGPLYPYVGTSVTSTQTWIDDSGQEQVWVAPWSSSIYGLMTREGRIVTDPVYQSVVRPTYRYAGEAYTHPVYFLSLADPAWNDDGITNGLRYAVAALNGSWRTGFDYWTYTLNADTLLLLGPEGVTRMDPGTGERTDWTWEELGIADEDLPSLLGDILWLYGFQWAPEGTFLGFTDPDDWENTDIRLFDPANGGITIISRTEWEAILDAHFQKNWNTPQDWDHVRNLDDITITRGEEVYTLPIPEGLQVLNNVEVNGDLAIFTDYSGIESQSWLCRLSDGSLLTQGSYIGFLTDPCDPDAPAFVRAEELRESQTLYNPDFEPFLFYDDSNVYFSYQDGLITARDDASFFACYDAQTGDCILYRNLHLGD